ncbi:MAG: 6-carboxytetrahydropterin synthase [Candidatus Hydrogenedentes bacterium]|nr:6-carboxytetrahydropterin synthase [Candidatus Hydrogenedentota bacterium]
MTDVTIAGVRSWIKERLAPTLPVLKDVHVSVIGPCAYCPAVLAPDPAWKAPQRLRFGFEAAHALPNLPKTHKCSRMHGHSFSVEVGAEDLIRLESALSKVYRELDHTCLNEIPGLQNATSEQISKWIWARLAPDFPDLEAVIVAETCTARCVYRGL